MSTLEKRHDTDMYLIAAYIAYGARLVRDEVTSVGYGRKMLVVEGEPFKLEQAEHDWYESGEATAEFPSNILMRYSVAIKLVKALIHSSVSAEDR